jgi:exodeoxyribonuclease V
MQLSIQQDAALRAVTAWLRTGDKQVFRLFGYAGTGKSTLARLVADNVKGRVLFAAFTAKAALIMRQKGCRDASTIHKLIYECHEDPNTGKLHFTLNRDSPLRNASLLIVDECSMVDERLGLDLLSFGTKILVLGDPAQLPPVNDDGNGCGFFTDAKPDIMLTEVHRQARDNPIIAVSMQIRAGERLTFGNYGSSRIIRDDDLKNEQVLAAGQVLVGRHVLRHECNRMFRTLLRRSSPYPETGDRLVCLRNRHDRGLLNGSLWRVEESSPPDKDNEILMRVKPEDGCGSSQRTKVRQPGLTPTRNFLKAVK